MSFHPPPTRPPSLLRSWGKFGRFLLRGHGPGLAWWLAQRDAVMRNDYRHVRRPALVAAWRADPSWTDLLVGEGRASSRALGLEFRGDDPVSRGYATWRSLALAGWRFEDRGVTLLASRDGLTLQLQTEEEEEMIKEIYLRNCYDVRLPGRWQVVDVGANVGMAALFFARQPGVERVYSYEPFAPTADGFVANLSLNPQLAPKIQLTRLALGEAAGEITVDYDPALRGSMSLTGLGSWRSEAGATGQKIRITVQPASAVLAPVFSGLNGCRLFAKIDCEGSEYGILRELDASGALAHFSALVIEWHSQGPDELLRILAARGFALQVHPLSPDSQTLGLIYATRLPPATQVEPCLP